MSVSEFRIDGSPHVEMVTLTRFETSGQTAMRPDGFWDVAILKSERGKKVLRTGLTTRTVYYAHDPGDEILSIAFRPSSFMPHMPSGTMVDIGILMETIGRDRMRIGDTVREIPTLDNVDVFIEWLARDETLVSDGIVASMIGGSPRAMSERSLQRHFRKTAGLTYKHFTMIQRAQRAVAMLQTGHTAADTAFALGYSDQAHMIHSLKRIMDATPGQIAKGAR